MPSGVDRLYRRSSANKLLPSPYRFFRIALRGANGSGKSTLLEALRGAPLETRGELGVSQFRGALIVVSHDQRLLENCGIETEFIVDFQP